MSIHTPQGEPAEGQTSVPRPEDMRPTRDDSARVVRIRIEQPAPREREREREHPSGVPGWLWVVLAIIALIVAVVAAIFVVGAIHGATGAIRQQTGQLARQTRILGQIEHQLSVLIQTIQQGVQALLSRLPAR